MANSKKPTTATETPAAAVAAAPAAAEKKPAAAKKAAAAPAAETPAAPAVVEKKPAAKKAAAAPAAEAAPVAAEAVAPEAPAVATDAKGRRVVTKETVREEFSSLIALINEQIDKRTASEAAPAEAAPAAGAKKNNKRKKDTGIPIKVLRSINKRLATLQNDACKMMKLKTKITRDNTNSGLLKPVGISEALSKFLKAAKYEVDPKGQYARTDITRKLHAYIKDNNLRKEEDKRIIVPDSKLAALLNYDAATASEDMTYFKLPVYLKPHFIKL